LSYFHSLGVGTRGRGKGVRKACRRMIQWKYYVLTYENGKKNCVETIPGVGLGGIKKNDGGSELNCDIL
jgi:hypothetical protein